MNEQLHPVQVEGFRRFILAASDVDRALVEAEVARLGLSDQWLQCQPG